MTRLIAHRSTRVARRRAANDNTEASMMTPCQRHALNHAFLVALYAATGHPQHSELAYVRLLSHLVLHDGTGGDPRWAS